MTSDIEKNSFGSEPGAQNVEDVSVANRHGDFAGRDKAAEIVDQARGQTIVTAQDDRRILRKIDLTILPILLTIYFLQQLDKSTLSYASVFGLIQDANLQGEDYSWLASIVYIAQLVLQPPIAYFLVKLPTGKFLGFMVFGWGAVLTCMAAANNFQGLMATRFFLGAFEASVAPIFVAVTQMWWRRSEQTNRNAFWYAMNGVTSMVGSLLAYGLGHISSSKLHSYQIIFLFCGLITVIVSILVFFFMPDSPVEAKFLNQEDKIVAVERLRANQMGIVSTTWKWEHFYEAMLDLKSWFWFALILSISIPSGGITTFGPLIIQSFGYNSFNTILLNIPFGAVQIIATIGGAYLATYLKRKGPVLALLCLPPIIGCAMLLTISHTPQNRGALLTGYYLISFYPGISPLIYSWSAQNTAGETKKKCTTALIFIGQSAGNIIGPHLYTPSEAPTYTRGLSANLALFIIIVILVVLASLYIVYLNKKHAAARERVGKSGVVVDRSMLSHKELLQEEQANTDAGTAVQSGDKAFNDETDLKNEDFIYVF